MFRVEPSEVPMKWTDQDVPMPDRDAVEGGEAGLITGQDGRLAYEPGTGDIKTLEELQAMRNVRKV
jgi:hypothetical protein